MKRAIAPALMAVLLSGLAHRTAPAFDWRDPLAAKNAEANTLAKQGDFDKALDTYKAAQVDAPESPELHYNIGLALASQGKYDEAIQSFNNMIASKEGLKSKAHYNIGVCQYRMGMAAEESGDNQKALEQLQACMESNREAMKIDPADADAKFNFEQAKRAWKELYDKLKQQQKDQPQSQPQNQSQSQPESQPTSQLTSQPQNQQGQNDQQKENQEQQEEQSSSQPTSQPDSQPAATATPTPPPTPAAQSQPSAEPSASRPQPAQPQQGQELTEEQARRILNQLDQENAQAFQKLFRPQGMPIQKWQKDW